MRIKIDGALVRENIKCSIESKNETVDVAELDNIYALKMPKLRKVTFTLNLNREHVAYGLDTINLVNILDLSTVPFQLERWQKAYVKVMDHKYVNSRYDPRLHTVEAEYFRKGFEYKK